MGRRKKAIRNSRFGIGPGPSPQFRVCDFQFQFSGFSVPFVLSVVNWHGEKPATMSDPLIKTPASPTENEVAPSSKEEVRLRENPRAFSLWERVQICLASWVGYLAVLLIGRSLRWEVYGWENWEAASKGGQGLIYTFWHREIFSACWFWRKRRSW